MSVYEDVEKLEFSCIADRSVNVAATVENNSAFPR